MDAEAEDELARLRARAYGPDADLADDPAAWVRLRELEEAERRRRSAPVASAPAPATGSDPHEVAEVPLAETPTDEDAPTTERRSRRPIVRRRRTFWLWAGSLAAVAALASVTAVGATTFVPIARTAGVAQVDTLAPDPSVPVDALSSVGFTTGEVIGFQDFYGVTTYAGSTQIDSAGNRAPCLFLIATADVADMSDSSGFQGGFRYGGCGAGSFPATVEFVVTPELPDAFRQRFPVGSAVQFVRDGDRVGVFSDAG